MLIFLSEQEILISPCDILYDVLPYLPLKNFTSAFLETVDLSYSSIPNSRYDTRISTAPGSKFFCLYSSISTFFVIPCSITSFCIFSGSLARVSAADFSISPSLNFSIASGSKFLEICWYSCTVALAIPIFFDKRSTILPFCKEVGNSSGCSRKSLSISVISCISSYGFFV